MISGRPSVHSAAVRAVVSRVAIMAGAPVGVRMVVSTVGTGGDHPPPFGEGMVAVGVRWDRSVRNAAGLAGQSW